MIPSPIAFYQFDTLGDHAFHRAITQKMVGIIWGRGSLIMASFVRSFIIATRREAGC
jgi:hypothetical protein